MIVRSIADLRAAVQDWRRSGLSCALVPTMGALHEGHLALIRLAARSCDRVVVSIFVNPLQFGPHEDVNRYPRRMTADVAAAIAGRRASGIRADGGRNVSARPCHHGACRRPVGGAVRPAPSRAFRRRGDGGDQVAVADPARRAFFGEKDYQQLLVIRRLARDLDIPVRIEGMQTVRDPDGLAMSSRNAYLSEQQRRIAPVLAATLGDMARRLATDGGAVAAAVADGQARLRAAGFTAIDYVEVCDAETLAPLGRVAGPARVLAAVWLGDTRLIDNVAVAPSA